MSSGKHFLHFIRTLGFEAHPFAKTNAATEERLGSYFLPPPYFHALHGDAQHPTADIVYAPRGAGKTALRLMLQKALPESAVLPIPYDHFPPLEESSFDSFSTGYHLTNIITSGLVSVFNYMIEHNIGVQALPVSQQHSLYTLAQMYLTSISQPHLIELSNSLASRKEQIANFWNKWRHVGSAVLSPLLSVTGFGSIPELPSDQILESPQPHTDFLAFKVLCRKLDFKSIYVLVDRVDETPWTSNDAEMSYELIASLLNNLPLLDDMYVGWKFFLWDSIQKHALEKSRPDRVSQYNLSWDDDQIRTMLSRRLHAYSNGAVSSISDISERQVLAEIDQWFIVFAGGSPRDLSRVGNYILAEQAETDHKSTVVTEVALEKGLQTFSNQLVYERFPTRDVKTLLRLGLLSFTAKIMSDRFGETGKSSRGKIRRLLRSGGVSRAGNLKSPDTSQVSHYFVVTDPRLALHVQQIASVTALFELKAVSCTECGKVIFSEFEDRDDEMTCPHCHRSATSMF